jgi:signal transduction histidine kinase
LRILAQLFGPRIETRFVSTISLVVAIALVSLIVVVTVQVQEFSLRFREEQIRLIVRLAHATYPLAVAEPKQLPPEIVQVTTLGPEGEVRVLSSSLEHALDLSAVEFPPGQSSGFLHAPEGTLLVHRRGSSSGEPMRTTWVAFSHDALDRERWLLGGKIVLVGAAILLSCYFLGVFLARSMLVPLERFTESMARVSKGDLTPILVPEAPENFGQFQDAFNVMLEQIRRNQEMERALLARDKMATVGKLASAVAHETRNPLAAISSLTQMLAEEVREDPRLREYTRIVLEEVARLDSNITHLLDYARPLQASFERIRVDRLLEDVRILLGFEVRRKGIVLETSFPEGEVGEVSWFLDAGQIKQILVNLVTNATRACSPGGRIEMGFEKMSEEELLLWVEDDGEGISEEVRERIFQPFFSASQGGTGLGLAVAARIVELHCGTIGVEDRAEGSGVRFVVRLPGLAGSPELPIRETQVEPSPWPQRS